jgi:hypothetical protein
MRMIQTCPTLGDRADLASWMMKHDVVGSGRGLIRAAERARRYFYKMSGEVAARQGRAATKKSLPLFKPRREWITVPSAGFARAVEAGR